MPFAIIWGETDKDLETNGRRCFTMTQAAARIGINERAFRRLMSQGEISPCDEKIFNIPLYLETDIEEFRQRRLKRHY